MSQKVKTDLDASKDLLAGKTVALTPIHVLVLIGRFLINSGGAQRVIANQIQNSVDKGIRYTVCNLFGEGTLGDQLPSDAKVIELNASGPLDFRILTKLRRILDEQSVNVVHTQSSIAGFWGRLAIRGKDVAVVSTEQNSHQRYRNLTGLLNGLTLPLADEITCVSAATRDSFFGWEKWLLRTREIHVIHNAVNFSDYADLPRDGAARLRAELGVGVDDLVLGNIARMDTQKNQHHLVREFAKIASNFPNAKLLIIGRGHLGPSLQKLIDSLGVADQVILVGARSDMDQVYRMLDVFVLPSLFEGFSLALLEGMSAGLPIVCSDIPQITEATGEDAIVADPTTPGKLAAALSKIISEPEQRKRLGQRVKLRAEKMFDAQELAIKYEKLYQRMVSQRKHQALTNS